MKNTTMTVKRAGTNLSAGIMVNIQNMAWRVAEELGGESPYNSYFIYSLGGGPIDVRLGDLLIDEQETDPLTGNATQYRVFGAVEQYFSVYACIPAEKLLGS
jgi:hypothetical protein